MTTPVFGAGKYLVRLNSNALEFSSDGGESWTAITVEEPDAATAQAAADAAQADADAAAIKLFNGMAPGRWFAWPNVVAGVYTSVVAERLTACPIFFPVAVEITKIAVNIQAHSASSGVRIGIYANTAADQTPGALVADCGVLTIDGTGIKTLTFVAVSLPAGHYWIGILPDVSGVYTAYDTRESFQHATGYVGAQEAFEFTARPGWYRARTYADGLPDPFGTPTAGDTVGVIKAVVYVDSLG